MKLYDLTWPDGADALQIEFAMIRAGGQVKHGAQLCGNGLFFHTRAAMTLLWPEDDHHRWSDLCLRTICEERITVLQGTKDSGKTRIMSKWGLLDYWTSPNDTLTLVSSTGLRELKLRIWGDMTSLFRSAKDRYPWLAGRMSNATTGIFTDLLEETGDVRDIRKGLIAIPCLGGQEEWVGMERYIGIKQKRRRLLGDECFIAGTLVDTEQGAVPIEAVRPGDKVKNPCGFSTVLATSKSFTARLCEIRLRSGQRLVCTPRHKFFTQYGWVPALHLSEKHIILASNETLRMVQKTVSTETSRTTLLRQVLLAEMDSPVPNPQRQAISSASEMVAIQPRRENQGGNLSADEGFQPDAQPGDVPQSGCVDSGIGRPAHNQRRQWDRTHESRMAAYANVPRGRLELRDQNRQMERQWHSACLQSGPGLSVDKTGYRSGWPITQHSRQTGEGSQEGSVFEGDWVDSVAILKPGDSGFPHSGNDTGRCRVFNLQVAGHPSYSVNGLLAHNCQMMHIVYLHALDALDKGDFKAVLAGNPIGGNGKALDKIAEPEAGWNSLGEITKTTTWLNKYDGVTVQLVGCDSPNFDADRPKDYPYLTREADLLKIKARNGPNSAQYWTLGLGVRKVGVDMYRVMTVEMCERNGGFEDLIWSGAPRTKVYAIDAGYGGDPCEIINIEFGEEVKGQQVISFSETRTIPIDITSPLTPEVQIANYVLADITRLGIPAANVFFDAGMRATLAVDMARIVGNAVNAVNFGGPATDRPVDLDTFVDDPKTGNKRLMLCSEKYSKYVTELWYSVREVVEARQARMFPRAAATEFALRDWRWVPGPLGQRYELETKPEYKARNGESPNKADVVAISVEGARRLGFQIHRSDRRQDDDEGEDWLEREAGKFSRFIRKHELNYG